MKMFIDVDNTILEHSGFYSIETESRIHSSIGKFPKENENAIEIMYKSAICRNPDIVKELLKMDNVYILTKYPAIEYEIHKQKRVAAILDMSHEELMNLEDSNGIKKYMFLDVKASKVEVVKQIFNLDNLDDCVLLDDYSSNLIEWENNGGIAIKYYNEYNSANHPLKGLSISNFKIFSHYIKQVHVDNLMIACDDSYKLNLFTKTLGKNIPVTNVDILLEVYNDLIKKLDLKKVNINSKYNLRNFIIEYYNFYNNIDPMYWSKLIKEKIDIEQNPLSLICASFDSDVRGLKIFEHDNTLAIKILESGNAKTTNIFDIYITLDKNTFLNDLNVSFDDITQLLAKFYVVAN